MSIKQKIVGETPEGPPQPENPGDADQLAQPPVPSLNIEVNIPLKFFSNFWRSLNLPKDCVSIEYHNITGVNFMNTSTKLYVPVET